MSVSKIDICNLALSHLGIPGIQSLTSLEPSSIACSNAYNPCRDDTFSEYRWPFATVRETLSLATDEVLGWDYVYNYPVKAARVWYVFDEGSVDTRETQEFEVVFIPLTNRRVICSNLSLAYAEYTYKLEDTTLYDSKFVMALSLKIAANTAHSLTGSVDMGIKLTELFNMAISEAKRVGYSERIKKPTQTSSYQNSRG